MLSAGRSLVIDLAEKAYRKVFSANCWASGSF